MTANYSAQCHWPSTANRPSNLQKMTIKEDPLRRTLELNEITK